MTKATKRLSGALAVTLAISGIWLGAHAAGDKAPAWAADVAAGKAAAEKGDTAAAQADWKKALAAAQAAKDDQAIAEIANQLANSYLAQSDIPNAQDMARTAKDAALRVLLADPKTAELAKQMARNDENSAVWINHMMKGQLSFDKNDFAQANIEYQAAVDKAKEYAPDGMPMASAMVGLGKTLVAQQKYKEAEPVLNEAIALCKKNWTPVTKPSALDAADAMDRLAVVMEKTGRHDQSVELAEQSKHVRETQSLQAH